MKYNIAMIVLVLLGAVLIADGYIRSNHNKKNVLAVRATVSAMSPQKLAAGIADCDPVRAAGEKPRQSSALCAELNRVLDEQRLQIVDVHPFVPYLPSSLPPLRLRKVEIVPLAPRNDTGSPDVFDLAKIG
jgi:hypothetical protein